VLAAKPVPAALPQRKSIASRNFGSILHRPAADTPHNL
jgi:hypothetical protein